MRRTLLFLVLAAVIPLSFPPRVFAWTLDEWGNLFLENMGSVLGERGSESGTSGSGEKKPGERRVEIRTPEGERTTLRERPEETRFETIQDGKRLRFERKDNETRVRLEQKTGETEDLPIPPRTTEENKRGEQELLRIRERADKKELHILEKESRFVIRKNQAGATSKFPLSVDVETNELIVTTPKGEKRVTVLPDQAVKNLLEHNVVDTVQQTTPTSGNAQVPGETAPALESSLNLVETTDGKVAYEVEGTKRKRLFGLVPLQIRKKAIVSAETGAVLETHVSFADRILDVLSF